MSGSLPQFENKTSIGGRPYTPPELSIGSRIDLWSILELPIPVKKGKRKMKNGDVSARDITITEDI